VTLRLTSSDPQVLLLSPNAQTEGTAFIDIPIANGNSGFNYYAHGLEGTTGTVIVTAQAPGFTDGTNSATVVEPAFDIVGLNANTSVGATDDPFQVRVGVPTGVPGGEYMWYEEALRAGAAPLTVTVDNRDGAVAQLIWDPSGGGPEPAQSVTVTIQPGNSRSASSVANGGVAFDPLAAGSTTVTSAIPTFFALPASTIAVTVGP
jgi:hypothetical protein